MHDNLSVLSDAVLGERIDQFAYEYQKAVDQVEEEQNQLVKFERKLQRVMEAHQLIQDVAQTIQQECHSKIATVVTRCLEAVFEEDAYQFTMRFEQKRGRTEAELLLTRNGMEIDPMTAAGGGIVDVTAFALRLVSLILMRPTLRRVFVADEPFRFLSKTYRPRVRQLIETLADEMDIQFIMVTHDPMLQIGKVVEL